MQVPNAIRAFLISLPLLSPFGLAACSDGQQNGAHGMPPSPVSVVTVQEEPIPIINELPGRITAMRVADVRPRVSGIVVERVFKQGTTVKEGDVLYRIDPEPFRLKVASAEATLQHAKAAQLQAKQQADRSQELKARNVTSVQALETSVAALAKADADVASAQAALSSAKLDLQYSDVKAPISGRIGRAMITEGALVGTGAQDVLATIQQLDPIYADFTQSVNDLLNLRRAAKEGLMTDATEDEAVIKLLFDNGRPYQHAGRLLFSEATVDATTGQVTMRGQFPNPDDDLFPGMYVRIQIEQGVEKGAVAIPQQAIQRDTGGQSFVYVVDEKNTAGVRPVKAGRIIGDRWVIDNGLKSGDRVIVEGFQKIRPGAPVAPSDWKQADKDAASAAPQSDTRNGR